MLPACVKPGVDLHYGRAFHPPARYGNGLIAVDTADTLRPWDRSIVVALLMQVGGLGYLCGEWASYWPLGRRVNLKEAPADQGGPEPGFGKRPCAWLECTEGDTVL